MKWARIMMLLGVATLVVWSCSSDNPAGPTTLPEAGSNSLLVQGEINGTEDIGSGPFSTSFLVTVQDSLGQPVNDAPVNMVHDQLGAIALPWNTLVPGEYSASASDYTEGLYMLSVRRGTDSLINGYVTAPDIHVILFPTTADTLQQDQPFTVTWSRQAPAASFEIETRDFGPALSTGSGADTGSYVIPASFNIRDDQRVRVWRSNTTVLNTGLAGSTLQAEIRNAVEPIVVE